MADQRTPQDRMREIFERVEREEREPTDEEYQAFEALANEVLPNALGQELNGYRVEYQGDGIYKVCAPNPDAIRTPRTTGRDPAGLESSSRWDGQEGAA